MLLHEGSFNGVRLLRSETVALMGQTISVTSGRHHEERMERDEPCDFFPGAEIRWGPGYMLDISPDRMDGRRHGELGGIFNTYHWLDPVKRVTGRLMTQVPPSADQRLLTLYGS